ncbi:MAG TPA: hypothetical protein VKD26_08120, partial [Streptosporangiaceae bacterium]|nr:hypothetical protein [Streptosporangiaceae bacterium]
MISLDVAALIVVAGRVLRLDTGATLDVLDVPAAEAALAEAVPTAGGCTDAALGDAALAAGRPGGDAAVLSTTAAGLLHALIRHRPFRRGNEQVAVAATLQFLAVNGWQADLDPPLAATAVVTDLATGVMTA